MGARCLDSSLSETERADDVSGSSYFRGATELRQVASETKLRAT